MTLGRWQILALCWLSCQAVRTWNRGTLYSEVVREEVDELIVDVVGYIHGGHLVEQSGM